MKKCPSIQSHSKSRDLSRKTIAPANAWPKLLSLIFCQCRWPQTIKQVCENCLYLNLTCFCLFCFILFLPVNHLIQFYIKNLRYQSRLHLIFLSFFSNVAFSWRKFIPLHVNQFILNIESIPWLFLFQRPSAKSKMNYL